MAKADLHVHSRYSAHPSEWFLQRLGARESYTDPDFIFRTARQHGMEFVTITDHNEIEGSLRLHERYPDATFTGVEVTAYFPCDGCKTHILIWGLTPRQFDEINRLRSDIHQLRDYIKQEQLAYAVAHATFSVNKKLTIEHIGRLLLLFDHFETINGSRTRQANEVFSDALAALTPDTIETLYQRYRIEPFSSTPWIKGVTGGTDDHSALFIGKTHTEAEAETPAAFLEQLRLKRTAACGRHNDFRGLAFAIYKIAYDYMQSRQDRLSTSLFGAVNQYIFQEKRMPLRSRIKVGKMRYGRRRSMQQQIVELIDICRDDNAGGIEKKIVLAYDKIAGIADRLFQSFIGGISKDVTLGDLPAMAGRISGIIPAVFMSLPFFTTMNLLHESRSLLADIRARYGGAAARRTKKIICFTDGPGPLSRSVHACPELVPAEATMLIASCRDEAAPFEGSGHIMLPSVCTFTASFIQDAVIRFPSILLSLKLICEEDPDEIIVASPGPVGMVGLLASRLLHVRCTGLYLPGYAAAFRAALGDDRLLAYSNEYLRWFYAMTDAVVGSDSDHTADTTARSGCPGAITIAGADDHRPRAACV